MSQNTDTEEIDAQFEDEDDADVMEAKEYEMWT